MIRKLEIAGVHMDVDADLRSYVVRKIGRLDKYLPRHARQSVHAEVKLKEHNTAAKKDRTCEVVMYVPHEALTVKESTINMYAAIDIVEEKLKTQLHKYKELHGDPHLRQRLLSRLKRGAANPPERQ